MAGTTTRLVQYEIAGELSHATLTFSARPETFARYEPLFDSAAQATRGAVEPESAAWSIWKYAPWDALVGAPMRRWSWRWRPGESSAESDPPPDSPSGSEG